jgi:hypothetical protein
VNLSEHPIDVALTYASKQEEYVLNVATRLKQSGVEVFYLPFEKVKLWGEDLVSYLQRIYRDEATLCVMFISKEYVESAWPNFERQSALERQMKEDYAYILPVKFDESDVPGISNTRYWLSASEFDEERLSEAILTKLRDVK